MAKAKVLIKGYVREENGIEFASSSTTLIQENGLNIIVDPGMNRKMLLDSLEKEGLKVEDINYVILTHTHLDHSLLAGIFVNAQIFDGNDVYSFDSRIGKHEGNVPATDIEIIETPGHDQFHCSVLVKTEDLGMVGIAGDVFWWLDGDNQEIIKQRLLDYPDPYVKDEKALRESRERLIEASDYIVPGHGGMFKIEK